MADEQNGRSARFFFFFFCIDYIAKERDNVFRMYSREKLAAKESRKENRTENNIFRVARSIGSILRIG